MTAGAQSGRSTVDGMWSTAVCAVGSPCESSVPAASQCTRSIERYAGIAKRKFGVPYA